VTRKLRHEDRNHRQRDQPERKIHQEDPAPTEVSVVKPPTNGPTMLPSPKTPMISPIRDPFPGRKDIADGGDAQRHHGPAADSSNGASRDQLAHVL